MGIPSITLLQVMTYPRVPLEARRHPRAASVRHAGVLGVDLYPFSLFICDLQS